MTQSDPEIKSVHSGKPEDVVDHEHFFPFEDTEAGRLDACLLADGRGVVYNPAMREYAVVGTYEEARTVAQKLVDTTRASYLKLKQAVEDNAPWQSLSAT